MLNEYSEKQVIEIIRGLCQASNQSAVAAEYDVDPSNLSRVLSGRMDLSANMAAKFGYEYQGRSFTKKAEEVTHEQQ